MQDFIPKEKYQEIEKMIESAESVVGIDAKETHIIIIHKLMEIEKRLSVLEEKLNPSN
ncbi:MAG: hypothetical protein AAFX87_12675 [Bacteroidota bacterium]